MTKAHRLNFVDGNEEKMNGKCEIIKLKNSNTKISLQLFVSI